MPSKGSPGFVGSRLREAREVREITGSTLAAQIGITKSGVSSYERGHTSPTPDVLEKIVETLKFKTEFFFRPEESLSQEGPQTIFERSRSATTKATRVRARHYRLWLREIVQYLSQFVDFPHPNLPTTLNDVHWSAMSGEHIESIALSTRRHWNLGNGPISNVTLLSEKQGVIVALLPMNSPKLDAFSTWDNADNRPYIVLSDTQSSARTRFNICHELGHLILHRRVSPSEFKDQRFFRAVEAQANRFAAAFLTPAMSFLANVSMPSLEQFRTLKPQWKVSIKMMVHRTRELGIIDRDEERRLYINYNRRGWNREEPLDDTQPVEEPRLVRRVFETIIDNSALDRFQVEAALPFNRDDVELLAGLPHGYLSDESAYSWAVREMEEWAMRNIGDQP